MTARERRAPLACALLLAATTGCEGDAAGPSLEALGLGLVAEGLVSPVALAGPPDGSGRLFLVDQIGRIRVIDANGELLQEPFLDVSASMVTLQSSSDERGLLGLAFHPSFASNRRFYVYYSAPRRQAAPPNFNHTSHVSEFLASTANPNRADPVTERVVLRVDQPQSNHNGGTVAFGPDGLLYVSLGDGGAANDVGVGHVPGGNAQDPGNLLGSILRIDVDRSLLYGIPSDNPFVGRAEGRDEVYAYGFRNPYRFSFDRSTGDLLVGDAGQNLWEEVNRVARGGNYGWSRREGTHCFDPASPNESPAECGVTGPFGEPLLDPVVEYPNRNHDGGLGVAVIGGYVYRGSALPELTGRYVFGDFSRSFTSAAGAVFAAVPALEGLWSFDELDFSGRPGNALGHYLKGMGEDEEGELYLLTSDEPGPTGTSGRVYRLEMKSP